MEETFGTRLRHAWNAFFNRDPTDYYKGVVVGGGQVYRTHRPRLTRGKERSVVTSVLNRIAMDASAIEIKHVRLDKEGRYLEDMKSGLNECLSLEANIDQSGRAFKHDIYLSTLDEGVIAIVPVETDLDPNKTGGYDITNMRTGKIIDWYPQHVKVDLYNEKTGQREDLILSKRSVAIVENPLYAVINEQNSTLQRLIRKLNLLDAVDEQSSSGKLDLIIQLPYVIKSETRRQQADQRRKDIEDQLKGSKYGIAYTDGTERITQLNRPVENNLMKQVEYLTNLLFGQLGMTQSILDGTADEQTMINYERRTIEPLVAAVVDEMKRKFLTKTARSQRQSIELYRDPFRLIPVETLATVADTMTRNEIMSKNEVRQKMGLKPSKDPKADKLLNSNISQPTEEQSTAEEPAEPAIEEFSEGGENQNGDS